MKELKAIGKRFQGGDLKIISVTPIKLSQSAMEEMFRYDEADRLREEEIITDIRIRYWQAKIAQTLREQQEQREFEFRMLCANN